MSKDTHGRSELEDRGPRTAWDCHKWEKPAAKTLPRCDLSYFSKFLMALGVLCFITFIGRKAKRIYIHVESVES